MGIDVDGQHAEKRTPPPEVASHRDAAMVPIGLGLALVATVGLCAACIKNFDAPEPAPAEPAVDQEPADGAEPRRVGPPEPVSRDEVYSDLSDSSGKRELTLEDFRDFIRWFDQARTQRASNHLAAIALHFARHQPPHREAVLDRQVHDAVARVAPRLEPSFTIGFEGAGECDVDFDNPEVLATYSDNAVSQIPGSTRWNEPCGNGIVRVEVLKYDHIHLNFETPTDCIVDAEFGRCSVANCVPFEDDNCVAIDPLAEPRDFAGHDGTTTIRIRHRVDGSNVPYTMHSFANVGNEPVKFRYRTEGGEWFQWNSLAGNTIWDTSAFTVDITDALIVNAGTSLSCGPDWLVAEPGGCPFDAVPIYIDDVSISP